LIQHVNSESSFTKDRLGTFCFTGPSFEDDPIEGFAAISATDAKFVQVIHSSTELGMNRACGTIDIFPNGGRYQPGQSNRQNFSVVSTDFLRLPHEDHERSR
jgi:hypothetical protein